MNTHSTTLHAMLSKSSEFTMVFEEGRNQINRDNEITRNHREKVEEAMEERERQSIRSVILNQNSDTLEADLEGAKQATKERTYLHPPYNP